jgi:hypothetical protein
MFLGSKERLVRGLTISPPSMSRLHRQCGILTIWQPYRPARPVTGIAWLFYFYTKASQFRSQCCAKYWRVFVMKGALGKMELVLLTLAAYGVWGCQSWQLSVRFQLTPRYNVYMLCGWLDHQSATMPPGLWSWEAEQQRLFGNSSWLTQLDLQIETIETLQFPLTSLAPWTMALTTSCSYLKLACLHPVAWIR